MNTPPPPRYPLLDSWRGGAVLLMVAYHFCYDLVFFRLAHFDLLGNPLWRGARGFIVGLFLLAVGVSLRLAARDGIRWPRFFRRLAWLIGCAGVVSLASLWLFPQRYIFFGILHFITVASLLGVFFIRWDRLNLALGIGLLIAGNTLAHPLFDQPALQWFGLVTRAPASEDYVPLLPWFGVVLCGLWLGRRLPTPAWGDFSRLRWLNWLGRHSLLVYMLHQPLLFALLYALVALRG
jgi:uncharacterized membrane protein